MKRVLIQTSAAIVTIASFGACESRTSAPATPSPISPSPQAPVPPPQPPPSRGQEVSTVSGVAYEHTAAGLQPVAGLPLHVEGRRDGKTWVTLDVVTDAAGRYEVPRLDREYVLVSTRSQEAYLSPCSVRMWLWNDEPLNMHVVSRANLLASGPPRSMPPFSKPVGYQLVDVLEGFVTERTADGTRPVTSALVEHLYGDGQSGDPTGFTLTTADGHYVLCGYWDDYGQAVRVRKDGYRTSIRSFGPSWRIDFELVRN